MIIRIVTLILLLTGCFSLSHAKTNGFRIGIQFGGTQFLGINIEKFYGDNSVRLNLGFFEVQEICISCSFNHYFLSSDVRPFVGIGLWDVLAITPGGIGSLTLLNVPIGVDWNVKNRHFLGAELDINYGIFCIDPEGQKEIENIFLPFPGIYYKYRL
jgi:hypothetical protein